MPEPTIFEKLMAKQIPCHVVYEDTDVFAFLDIEPLSPGHTLVVPRMPVARLADLPDDIAASLGRVLPRLCRAVCQVTGATDYNILQNNGALAHQAVEHVHFHIIPRPSEAQGLSVDWRSGSLNPEVGQALAKKVREGLSAGKKPG